MKNVCRRLTALLLVLALCFGLAVNAWAAEDGSALNGAESALTQEEESTQSGTESEEASAEESAAPEQSEEASAEESAPEQTPEASEEASAPEQSSPEPDQELPEQAEASEPEEPAPEEASEVPEESAVLPMDEELPDVELDKDLIERKEAFVRVGKNKNIELKDTPAAEVCFKSKDEKVATAQEKLSSAGKLVITGVSVGKTVVEMRRAADNTLLDTMTVYVYRPTTASQASGSRSNPGDLTTTIRVDGGSTISRTYKLVCQQKHSPGDQPFKNFLSRHGCTICASSAVCQAFGATGMTVDWMTGSGLEEIAIRSGGKLQNDTLGYYGMQQVLAYGGISSKIYNWKDDSTSNMEKAKEELVKSLSAGHPVLLFLDQNSRWNGIGPLCSALHCVILFGIDESGNVQIINSSYPHKVSRFKYDGSEHTVKLTPGELLDHFVRHSSMKRTKEDDLYFTKAGGLHTFLEVTCDKATVPQRNDINGLNPALSQNRFTYTGESFTPAVTVGSLVEGQDFRAVYSGNINAGTATAAVAGLGGFCGLKKLNFTIERAPGEITAADQTVPASAEEQSINLGASAKGGAKLSYSSDNEAVTVDSSGTVIISALFAGTVHLTLKSEETTNYTAASKTITLTVEGQDTRSAGKVTASGKTLTAKNKKQTVRIKASALGGAKLSYESGDKKVKVNSAGVVTLPKGYAGVVKLTIRAAATSAYQSAKKTIKLKVLPGKTSISSLKAKGGGKVQAKWKKAVGVGAYQIEYWSSKDSKGKVRRVKASKASVSGTLKGLKKGAKYQVRIRSYKKTSGTTLYSAWSGTKSVKVK